MTLDTFVYWLLLVVMVGLARGSESETKQPHILFIVADDLGWNDVSWNNPDMIMPTLDKMAHKGVILNASYVQPTCSPSRGALMTGYYPFHLGMQHGIVNKFQPKYMPADKVTLPEALKKLGYSTHMVGKWHLGFCNWSYTPTHRGFDSFYGFYSGAQDYYKHTQYSGYDFRYNDSVHYPKKRRYSTSLFARHAVEVLKTHDAEKQPLFMYMSFQGVHSPLQVPRRYSSKYKHIKNKNRRIYSGMVTALDEAVDKIMRGMQRYKYMDNLLVVFLSDNGAASYIAGSNWPLRGSKTTLWEGGTRVPSFVYSKTLIQKTGLVYDGLIHAVDWYPTLIRVAGGTPSPFIDGIDQWLSLSRAWPPKRSEFVYNINELKGSAAIRVGDYKLIVGTAGRYNNWYPPKSKPNCHAKQNGFAYQQEDIIVQRNEYLDEKEANRGWWFSRSFYFITDWASKMVKRTGAYDTWKSINERFRQYRCDKFIEAHKLAEKRIVVPRIQLFNIRDDPLETNNLADSKPVLVKKLIRKIKQYKKTLVPAQNQPLTKLAHPRFYDGIWSPGWC